jgi:hypothetical protein
MSITSNHRKKIRAEIRATRVIRTRAVRHFKLRHPGLTVYTDQVWGPHSQWGDFDFIHPTRKMIVRVAITTLAYAYQEKCDTLADESLEADGVKYPAVGNLFRDFIPIYEKRKGGGSRPLVRLFQMKDDEPEIKAARDTYYQARAKRKIDIINSGTVFVSEELKIERMPYGLYVSISLQRDELMEADFPLYQDYILGHKSVDPSLKTFTQKTLNTLFGMPDSMIEDDASFFQPVAVRV